MKHKDFKSWKDMDTKMQKEKEEQDNIQGDNRQNTNMHKESGNNAAIQQEKWNAMLKVALYEQLETETEYENIEEEEHKFSKDFEYKMEELMSEKGKKKRYRSRGTVAAVLAVVVLAAGLVGMHAEAIKVPVLNFMKADEYSVTDYGAKKSVVEVPEEYEEYAPTYVPEGFELVYTYARERKCYLQYRNSIDGKEYEVIILNEKNRIAFDSEDAETVEKKIGGYDALIADKDGIVWLSCILGNHTYSLEGEIELEDAEEILKSVE